MADYRLYHIANDHFSRVEILEAADDMIAIAQAGERLAGGAAELWCGARRVRYFEGAQETAR